MKTTRASASRITSALSFPGFQAFLLLAFSLQVFSLFPVALRAADVYWGGVDDTWGSANWHTTSPTGPAYPSGPAAADTVHIDSGRVTVGLGVTATSGVGQIGGGAGTSGTVTVAGLWGKTGLLHIGDAGQGALYVQNGGVVNQGADTNVGSTGNGSGLLYVSNGGNFTQTGILRIAGSAANQSATSGTLIIEHGGTVTTGGNTWIGAYGSGTALIDGYLGAGTGASIFIGVYDGSQGVATVGGDGVLDAAANLVVGYNAGASGTLVVEGLAKAGVNLNVGQNANATGNLLDIKGSGTVQIGSAINLAYTAGASGTINVAGRLEFGTTINITGTGVLNIAEGGYVSGASTGNSLVGSTASGNGAIIVGGILDTSNRYHIGNNGGSGYLEILGTGTAYASVMCIAYSAASVDLAVSRATSGAVIVREGGLLRTSDYLQVGQWAQGQLLIEENATVNVGNYFISGGGDDARDRQAAYGYTWLAGRLNVAGAVTIGNYTGGVLEVTETGTLASTTGILHVGGGNGGQGLLTIEEGGVVRTVNTAGNSLVGSTATGSGTITVGGLLETANRYHIGNNGGSGYLEILGTGTVKTGIMCIAYSAASVDLAVSRATNGAVIVREGGFLQTAGYLQVGQWGPGSLIIEKSATVIVDDYFYSGGGDDARDRQAAYGYTHVAGRLHVVNSFGIANACVGVLDIADTGVVTTTGAVTFANNAEGTGSGTANVAGLWQAQGNFTVGVSAAGRGFLNILPTGTVSTAANYRQNTVSSLSVSLQPGRTTPYLEIAGNATLAGTLDIHDFSGTIAGQITKSSQIPTDSALVIRATGGYIDDFNTINNVGGATGLPSFITFSGFIDNETDYRVGYALAGTIDLAPGQTFEIDVPLRDVPASAKWDGKSLIKTGEGTLIYSATTVLHTGVTLVNGGVLMITSPSTVTAFRGDLINNSVIDLATPATTGHRTLRVPRLYGSGTFLMSIDSAAGAGDLIDIVGDTATLKAPAAEGVHHLVITDIRAGGGTATAGDLGAITLVKVSGTGANNATYTGGLDVGPHNYAVQKLPSGLVVLGGGALSVASNAILEIAGAQNLMWFGQQDNLGRRLGDLRMMPARAGRGALWARAYAEHATIDAAATGRGFNTDLYGLTVGADKTWPAPAAGSRLLAGLFANFGQAAQTFRARATQGSADGASAMFGAGLYAAWLHDNGLFANATLGVARYKNKFNASDQGGNLTTGRHNDTGAGLSLEIGRRLKFAGGWFAEPSAQAGFTLLAQNDYTTTGINAAGIRATAANILRARAGVLAGRGLALSNGSLLQIHARLSGACETSSGGEVAIETSGGDARRRPNLDGARAEAGLGAVWQLTDDNHLYFDYEAAYGKNYEKPWGLSLGFRHGF